MHPAPSAHHAVPSLLSNHSIFPLPGSSATTALLIQRTNEEEKWLARQRRLRQEKEDRQSQVSEFRQQVLEQHLDMGRPPVPTEAEHRPESARWGSAGSGSAGEPRGVVFTLGFARSQPAFMERLQFTLPPERFHLLPRAPRPPDLFGLRGSRGSRPGKEALRVMSHHLGTGAGQSHGLPTQPGCVPVGTVVAPGGGERSFN